MLVLAAICTMNIFGAIVYRRHKPEERVDTSAGAVAITDRLKVGLRKVCKPILVANFITTILWNCSSVLIIVFLYSYVVAVFNDMVLAATAATLFGGGQLLFCIVMSIINSKIHTNKYLVQLVSLLIMSSTSFIMGFMDSATVIAGLAFVYGCSFGMLRSNIPNFVKHINGSQNQTLLYAICQLCGGMGSATSPPLLTELRKYLPLNSLFFLSSAMAFFGFSILLGLLAIQRRVWYPFNEDEALPLEKPKQITPAPSMTVSPT